MALFKIFKGKSINLGADSNDTKKTREGFAYFTPDDGKFYIDITEGEDPVVGNNESEKVNNKNVNRICINQRIFTYQDYDVLDCGTSATLIEETDIVFDCN